MRSKLQPGAHVSLCSAKSVSSLACFICGYCAACSACALAAKRKAKKGRRSAKRAHATATQPRQGCARRGASAHPAAARR
jgi:hypothetical protein